MLGKVFDRLEAANAAGVPTAMVGQGIGPINDLQLLARAREILPTVGFILYRNQRYGYPLLEFLNVLQEKIFLTGDDAIEMTYNERTDHLGNGIGISLRFAHYTQVTSSDLDTLRVVLYTSAQKHNAPLVAAPISSYYQELDMT